jgi:hypothetical protein
MPRQGNPQLGFEICPHTCGCIITQSAISKSRKKPQWMKGAPIALKDGHHLTHHIKSKDVHPNCTAFCSRFESPGRDLTHEEWTAWTPHLGHYTPFAPHIPVLHRSLIPATPLEENYAGTLPNHPLPNIAPSLPQGFASMSLQASTSRHPSGPSQHPSHQIPSAGPSNAPFSSLQYDLGPKPKLLFVETPRVTGMNADLQGAKHLLVYYRYLLPKDKPSHFKKALETAPPGMAILEPMEIGDPYSDVISYYIHDTVSIFFDYYFSKFSDFTRWHGFLHF